MAEQAKRLTGAAAAAAKGKELAGRIKVLAAGLVDRGLANDGEEFDAVAVALDALDRQDAEIRSLKRQLTAQKGAATKARAAAAAAVEAARPDEPRALGPVESEFSPAELLTLIQDAETVEIAFSDGKTELAELPPHTISGDAWRMRGRRLFLEVPSLVVHGPRPGAPGITIEGYALLLDGEQVAWQPRAPLTLRASSKVQLKDDISFA